MFQYAGFIAELRHLLQGILSELKEIKSLLSQNKVE